MREIRPSGSEGGAGFIPRPYPYHDLDAPALGANEKRNLHGSAGSPGFAFHGCPSTFATE